MTSQPSVGDFLAVYEPIAEAGHDIVSVHIASGLSGTYESAREAAKVVAEKQGARVEVFDGSTGAGGLGCLVVAAARAAETGADVDAVVEAVRAARETLDIWFCLDTLEYLRRGGRIGAAQALLGSALQIKPILTFGTEIKPIGRVRTRQARVRADGHLPRGAARPRRDRLGRPARAGATTTPSGWSPAGTELLGFEPLFCTQVGPVLGTHLGSGMLVGGVAVAQRLRPLAQAAIQRVAQGELARVVVEAEARAVHDVGEADAGVGIGEAERAARARRAEREVGGRAEAEARERLEVAEREHRLDVEDEVHAAPARRHRRLLQRVERRLASARARPPPVASSP